MPDADDVVTWHHGLIARWWANFNVGGPELDFFASLVADRQPVLDAACGTGRLLVPWLASGLDVDGVDASADMIEACRRSAASAGLRPTLHVQALHRLDLPRRYGSIVVCGGFGLGGSREHDVDALRRMHEHLGPGGLLAMDQEVAEDVSWERLRSRLAGPLQHEPAEPPPDERRLGADGYEYALRGRLVAVDPRTRSMERELTAWQWRDGDLVARETHRLALNVWTRAEVVSALHECGFVDVRVVGGYHGGEPTDDDRFVVFLAHRPAT